MSKGLLPYSLINFTHSLGRRPFYIGILSFFVLCCSQAVFAYSDLYLEGNLVGVYTSDGDIITQNTCTVSAGVEACLIPSSSTILNPGFRVAQGGSLRIFPSDGDSLPDDWEMAYFGNLSQTPDQDYDNDGVTNYDEYDGGSDPTDPNSVLGGGNEDADGDGLPDDWETQYFGNLNQGPDDDYENDGATNYEEWQLGTDPRDGDTDDDGMDDGWEVQYGFDPLDPSGAYDDNDGDCVTNYEEYVGGSNPTDPWSVPWSGMEAPYQIVGYTNGEWRDTYSNATIIIFYFLRINPDGSFDTLTGGGYSSLEDIVTQAHQRGIKVLISVGGSASIQGPVFEEMADDDDGSRANFIANVKNFVAGYCLDGVDIDWEGWLNDNKTNRDDEPKWAAHMENVNN